MRGFSFLLNKEYYAVDVDFVHKIARGMIITPVPAAPDEIIGIVNLKGRVITILSLYRLLGNKDKRENEHNVQEIKAVIFKSFSDNEDQFGLFIDKPGDMIDIDDSIIHVPYLTTGAKESFCISGIFEANSKLYRIIDIESIIKKYKNEKNYDIELNGGNENV